MWRGQYYLASVAVVVSVALLLALPAQLAVRLKFTFGSPFLPLFGLIGAGRALVDRAVLAAAPRRALLERLRQLEEENRQLRGQLVQADEARRENARLRALVGWPASPGWHYRVVRVVGRDPSNWWRVVWIDAGRKQGMRPGMPVLGAEGLVGRIGEVGYSVSQVVLVGDPKCRVAVVVRETGENGVLSAISQGVLDHRLVDLTHLPRHTALKPGQTVCTSGLGGVFPAGILVGAIADSRSVASGLATEARVKLAADISRLEEVVVLAP